MKVEATIRRRTISYQRVSIELPDNTPKDEIFDELIEEADLCDDWEEESSEMSLITRGGVPDEDCVVIDGEVSNLFDGEAM